MNYPTNLFPSLCFFVLGVVFLTASVIIYEPIKKPEQKPSGPVKFTYCTARPLPDNQVITKGVLYEWDDKTEKWLPVKFTPSQQP